MNIGNALRIAAKPLLGTALALVMACGLLPVQSFAKIAEGGVLL